MGQEKRNVIGYCAYCKETIYEDDVYVVRSNSFYHKKCDKLIYIDYEPDDDDNEGDFTW